MGTRIAKIISYLFHPLLMPTLGIWLVLNSDLYFTQFIPTNFKLTLYGLIAAFTCFMPALNAFFLLRNGFIKSLQMETKEERRIPFITTAIFYFSTYYLLNHNSIPVVIKLMILGATMSIVLAYFINFFWKISAHMIGMGGIVGAMIGISIRLHFDQNFLILILILLSGILGFARLQLKSHQPMQIYAGFFLGAICELVLLLLVK